MQLPEMVRPDVQYKFGEFVYDPSQARLSRGGTEISLQKQSRKLLEYFLGNRGRLLTKADFRVNVWKQERLEDSTLHVAITRLRSALGDQGDSAHFIETKQGEGYIFKAVIHEITAEPTPISTSGRHWLARGTIIASVFLAIILLALKLLPKASGSYHLTQVTSTREPEYYPSILPHNDQVAFVRVDAETGYSHVWIRNFKTGVERRLTVGSHEHSFTRWSPDGREIAFLRRTPEGADVMVVDAEMPTSVRRAGITHVPPSGLSWSPDGTFLVFSDREDSRHLIGIFRLRVADGERLCLSVPPSNGIDGNAAISPDQRALVFVRTFTSGASDLFRLDLDNNLRPKGTPKRLTRDETEIAGVAWLGTGTLIFSSRRDGRLRLWRISDRGLDLTQLPFGEDSHSPEATTDGRRIAFVKFSESSSIWGLRNAFEPQKANELRELIYSTQRETSPDDAECGPGTLYHWTHR